VKVPRYDSKNLSTPQTVFGKHPQKGENMIVRPVVRKEKGLTGHRYQVSNFHDYVVSILIALVLTVFYGGYYMIQRTYMVHAPPGIDAFYVPDKVIAVVGMTLLAFTFLIGPIYRYFDAFDYLLEYRKEIGIIGGFFALFHPVMAYFFLPLTFPQSEIPLTSVTYGAGLAGSLVVIFLIFISYENAKILLGPSRWWLLHRFGLRLVILFAVIHFFCIEWSTWVQWLTQSAGKPSAELLYPWMPEPTIFAGLFIVWVIIVRLYETVFLYKDFGLKPKEIAPDANLRLRGRRFFIYSFSVLIACNVFVFGRWMYYFSIR
jgi:DMSO/TMAO reductase YedYZ heme-binding membrane subunit